MVRSLYFRIFSASFFITFLSLDTTTSIIMYVIFSLSLLVVVVVVNLT
jgi:hypothetical protein